MFKSEEELIVITKTYDLILWTCNHTGRFPRNHRFVLGERIERLLFDLLETLIEAKYTRERLALHMLQRFSAGRSIGPEPRGPWRRRVR